MMTKNVERMRANTLMHCKCRCGMWRVSFVVPVERSMWAKWWRNGGAMAATTLPAFVVGCANADFVRDVVTVLPIKRCAQLRSTATSVALRSYSGLSSASTL